MTENEYYKLMNGFNESMSFDEIHNKWYKCFDYILRSYKSGHNKFTIKSLFYDFDMDNWDSMHKENSKYKNYTNLELLNRFCGECSCISDRASYDRLFRTHWLFRQSFSEEIDKIKYPSFYY